MFFVRKWERVNDAPLLGNIQEQITFTPHSLSLRLRNREASFLTLWSYT